MARRWRIAISNTSDTVSVRCRHGIRIFWLVSVCLDFVSLDSVRCPGSIRIFRTRGHGKRCEETAVSLIHKALEYGRFLNVVQIFLTDLSGVWISS